MELRPGAYETFLTVGDQFDQMGFYFALHEIYTEMLDFQMEDSNRVMVLARRAINHDALGNFDAAIADYSEAITLDLENITSLNGLCWDYAMINQPEVALPFCEEVVIQTPKAYYKDSRGVVYALLDRYEEAIADFEVVIDSLEGDPNYSNILETRLDWVSDLEAGNNPITPNVLEELRTKYTMRVSEEDSTYVPKTVDFSRSSLQARIEDQGYIFKEPEMIGGEEVLIGTFAEANCEKMIELYGSESRIVSAAISIYGCTDAYKQGDALWFMGLFIQESSDLEDNPLLGKLIAWSIIDIYYIIEGFESSEVTKGIGNITYSAIQLREYPNTFKITASINE
jgi:tetratricopeptide (TPR) repeat protein